VNRVQLGCTVPGFFFFSGSHPSLTASLSLSNSLSQTPLSLLLNLRLPFSVSLSQILPICPSISLNLSQFLISISSLTLSHSGRRKNKGEKKNRGRRMGAVREVGEERVDRIGPFVHSFLFFLKPPYSLNYNIAPTHLVLSFLNCHLTPYI